MKLYLVHLDTAGHNVTVTGEAELGTMIVAELTEKDRENIANMAPDATLYAVFDESEVTSRVESALDAIKEGSS